MICRRGCKTLATLIKRLYTFAMPLPFTKITDIPLGPITLQAWGVMVALGMLIGLYVVLKEAERKGLKRDSILDMFLGILIASIAGSRLFYVLLFWRDFVAAPFDVFKIWEGGLVFYGGIFASMVILWIYTRAKKLSFLDVTDTMAPGFAIGIFFGRIGCYLIGDHIGAPMKGDWFWGSVMSGDTVLRHEPSLYLSLNGLLMFLVLWHLRSRLSGRGDMTMAFFLWYGFSRFFLDFFRSNDLAVGLSDPRFWGLTISQYVSIVLFLMGGGFFLARANKRS